MEADLRRRRRATRFGRGWAIALLGLTLLVAGCSKGNDNAAAATKARGVPVTVASVDQKDVPVSVTAIGNVQASATVAVLSQMNGQITKVHFTEGQDVEAGQLLFTIDPRPFEAALAQAQANLARDRAMLRQAEASVAEREAQVQQAEATLARDRAQLENARVQEGRYKELVDKELVAREQYDQMHTNAQALAATVRADEAGVATAGASARAAEATVENVRASIQADEAAVEQARLQVGYTRIRSPMTGRTGNLLIHDGNVVKSQDVGNPMVTINQVHPVYVAFAVPEQYLEDIKRFQATGALAVEAAVPGQTETRSRGTLTFLNNAVDPATGTIQLKATFPNANNSLWPGQFVNVTLTLTTQRGAVIIPSQAVQTGQQGPYVFVVKPDQTVETRPVTPGRTIERVTVIDKGLTAGERVVTDGHLRLFPGAKVDIKSGPAS